MVFDRTEKDVEDAKQIIAEKVKKFVNLTEEELEILNRGTITIDTLNRIEAKQNEIKELINGMGYWSVNISNRIWEFNDIFDESNFQRIIENLNILKKAFYTYSFTPETPRMSYRFENINDIEKILYDLDLMVSDMKEKYRECGTFECGEG